MKILLPLLVIFPFFLLSGCGEPETKTAIPHNFIGKWKLYEMPGYDGPTDQLFSGDPPVLNILDQNGTIKGQVACQPFEGSILLPDSIKCRVQTEFKTVAGCKHPGVPAFFDALAKVDFHHWQQQDTLWMLNKHLPVLKWARISP